MPWAFTESGIYMLMTVLKGDLSTKQSIELICVLQKMKDYITESSMILLLMMTNPVGRKWYRRV